MMTIMMIMIIIYPLIPLDVICTCHILQRHMVLSISAVKV